MSIESDLQDLRDRIGEVADLQAATSILEWDQETYMPPKGAEARGQQLATLSALSHRMFTDPELGALLRRLNDASEKLSADDATLVSETFYDYDRSTKYPEAFVKEFAEAQSRAFNVWLKAREQSDFAVFQPELEHIVDLNRRKAELAGYEGSPYNGLLEGYERGMRAETLREIFATLAARQSELVKAIVQSGNNAEPAWLNQDWDETAQWDVAIQMLKDMGYDLDAGRQDKAAHPFTMTLAINDVRVTTRIHRDRLFSGFLSSLHEGGHALYEQGFQPQDARTTLAASPSLGMHESQSRLWENIVGRSLPFWRHYMPLMQKAFSAMPETVAAEDLYRAVNRVEPSLIRVEADECTYNLHVILRFEIEVDLIEGRIEVKDVPAIWNEKMKSYLGVDVPDDARGCLQDVHWSHGAFGYFPTYALGNLYSAQIFEVALRDIPNLWDEIAAGRFSPLLTWLREHVHRHGRRKTAPELVRDISGAEPNCEPFLRYLDAKFRPLYGI